MMSKREENLSQIINNQGNINFDLTKVEAAIFVRKSKSIIDEKVNYLSNILNSEAKRFDQNMFDHHKAKVILSEYKNKIIRIYNEYYMNYVDIQNLLDKVKLNKKVVVLNYQKIVKDRESQLKSVDYQIFLKQKQMLNYKLKLSNNVDEYNTNLKKSQELKSPIRDIKLLEKQYKKKYEMYENAEEKCGKKLSGFVVDFENNINNIFLISKSLQKIEENSLFNKVKSKIVNLFVGNKKFEESLAIYSKKVNQIDEKSIISKINKDAVSFIFDINKGQGWEGDEEIEEVWNC